MEERRDATSPGLPPLSGPLRNIHQELHALQGEFRDLRNSYLRVRCLLGALLARWLQIPFFDGMLCMLVPAPVRKRLAERLHQVATYFVFGERICFLTLAFGTDWCSKGVPQYHWLPFLLGVGGGRDKLVLADGVPLSLASGGRVHGVVEERGAAARIRGAWHKWGHRGLPHMCSRPRAWYVEDCFMET